MYGWNMGMEVVMTLCIQVYKDMQKKAKKLKIFNSILSS
jgi:hypothetical protein